VPGTHRVAPALGVGLLWAVAAAVVTGIAAVILTAPPAPAPDEAGQVIHRKGGESLSAVVVLAACAVMGTAAGCAGFAWRYTRFSEVPGGTDSSSG
jgi:hypothetical protein